MKGRHKRIILASSAIEVNAKIKDDEKSTLESLLGGKIGRKSPISSLELVDSMKDSTRFEHSSALSITEFSASKELAKMMREKWLSANLKVKEGDSNLKGGSRIVFP